MCFGFENYSKNDILIDNKVSCSIDFCCVLLIKLFMKKELFAPLGVALWLVDNTSLSFRQIADFCGLHELEIRSIADGNIGANMLPVDPIVMSLLTRECILECEKDSSKSLKIELPVDRKSFAKKSESKSKKYTPLVQRRNRINCILWLVNFAPELSDAQIVKMLNTTKDTVESIRNKTYSGYDSLTAKDPVVLDFISQVDLESEISKARSLTAKRHE